MSERNWHRQAALLGAFLVIFVSIAAKIPTSRCHCHEKKASSVPSDQSQNPCPFGQLRTIASTLGCLTAILAPAPQLNIFFSDPDALVFTVLFAPAEPFEARAPPELA